MNIGVTFCKEHCLESHVCWFVCVFVRIIFALVRRGILPKSFPIRWFHATVVVNDIDKESRRTVFVTIGKSNGDMEYIASALPISLDICLNAYQIISYHVTSFEGK